MLDLCLTKIKTQSAARLFLCVAYVGSLPKERGINSL